MYKLCGKRYRCYEKDPFSTLAFYHIVWDYTNSVDVDFTSLEVWKLSHELMLDVYTFVKLLPLSEKYLRVDQLKRSSSSTPANIAEGHGRYYYLENISFCRKARGSLSETKNHVIAARDLDQASREECDKLIEKCDRIRQVLNGYIRYLKKQKVENDAD